MMKVVYFTIPIVTGYYIMQVAIGYSERNTAPLLKEKAEERDLWGKSTEADALRTLGLRYTTQARRLEHVAGRMRLAETETEQTKLTDWKDLARCSIHAEIVTPVGSTGSKKRMEIFTLI